MKIGDWMELRNLVLIEPKTKEFLQISFLCPEDSMITEEDLLSKCGNTIQELGRAKVPILLKSGIYPVALYYERDGRAIRALQLEIDAREFQDIGNGIYQLTKLGYSRFRGEKPKIKNEKRAA